MSDRHDTVEDRDALRPEDESLVRRVAEAWRAPEQTPAERVAFQRRLDARLAKQTRGPSARWLRPLAGAAVLAAGIALALLAVTGRGVRDAGTIATAPVPVAPAPSPAPATDSARGEAIYALATEDDDTEDAAAASAGSLEALPDDYVAIASLFVDG